MYFNEDFSLHKIMKNHFDVIVKNIVNDATPISIGFEELAEFYLMSALYAQSFCDDKKKRKELLTRASSYSYSLLVFFNKTCEEDHQSLVLMRKAIYLWSSTFLVGWNNKGIRVGSELIDSLNKQGSIIRYGCRLYPESWFLIDLYSLALHKSYDKEYVDYPENMKHYEEILQEWDTQDATKVDLFVYKLCELHVLIKEDDKDEPDTEYLNFNKSVMKLYPYTAIGYLAIRKIKGLRNPETFSHPLMNTPVTTMFLELNEPLEKPKELPYAKELLEKLHEKCPQVSVPDWL